MEADTPAPAADTKAVLTAAYAAHGVFHILRFMHKHETQLRRKRVAKG